MQKNKWQDRLTYGITFTTIILLIFKWFGLIEASYWAVFAPILILIAGFIAVLIISIIVGSIAYVFKKDKIGERKTTLEKIKAEEDKKELEDWRKAYVKKEQMANLDSIEKAGETLNDLKNDQGAKANI